ncbi:D-threo-3-hydroxyaspartate dehydratase [Phytophthora citrophthora]|uniref:D-serine dehydratase n=1 Tax=Phytophthora citrophthora TaxID=4793 RepID=A0AAD9GB49_9STRA|nr:D-threo-3-hydroxyaspartate dehydratase [Phytophthora citrophthora]
MNSRNWMQTPSVVLDEKRLQHNIERMQALATANHVNLRPHAKTHKTREIATMQLAAGACGLTVSKPSEALQFLRGDVPGLKSVTLAYPVVQTNKVQEVIKAAQTADVEFLLTVDSPEGVDAAQKAAEVCGSILKLLIHIDVGYHRVGIEENDPKLLQLAQRIHKTSSLEFRGLLSHAGHAYRCKSVAECAEVAETERQIVVRIKSTLEASGIPVPVVSVGSTLTEPARKNFEGITEIRPGNYVFLDRTPVRMGLFSVQDVALTVLATVVSSNNYNFIVDAGSKVLSSDGARSAGDFGSSCFGLAFYENDFERVVKEPTQNKSVLDDGKELICFEVTSLSEEHGWVKKIEGIPSPAIGERLIIVPNHACVVSNLTNKFYVQGEGPKSWTLLSRGCTQ